MATKFSYNLVQPELPLRTQPVARAPYVNPGGNITLGEFNAGGARPNTYGLYDPRGAANLRAGLPYQALQTGQLNLGPNAPGALGYGYWDSKTGFSPQPLDRVARSYTPGQYGAGPAGAPPAAAPAPTGGNSALAIRPNAAPANIPSAAPAMKAADVLNVRTIPGTGGAAAAPALEAGAAGAGRAGAGVGSRLLTAAGAVGKALPLVGDVLQGAIYGYEGGSIGRGVAAGLGSFGGRLAGAAGGTLVAPGVGTAVGSVGGSVGGAAGAAKLYDMATGADDAYQNPAAVRQAEENAAMRAVPSRVDMPQGLTANTGGSGDAMRIDLPAPGSTAPQVTRQEPGQPGKYDVPSAATSKPKDAAPAKSSGFQGPSAEEMARFRKQTGTPYDPKSITDKLNLERMRAGEKTLTSKQSRDYRRANPDYRPGQYVKGR